LKLRSINASGPRLPAWIEPHRTEQFNAVFARTFDHQPGIDITGINQVPGGQEVFLLQ
jgi:hypothetical protein